MQNDYYDVSLVDGFNLPMSITPSVDCLPAGCYIDLGPMCAHIAPFALLMDSLMNYVGPPPLIGPYDSTGYPVGCKSACVADVDGNPC